MNLFKPIFLGLLLFGISNLTLAQIQKEPQTYRKIKFTYQQKSNFIVTDSGFYADTLLIKKYFPEMVFPKIIDEKPTVKTTGFIPFSEMNEQNIRKLLGILYHDNVHITGIYDVKKRRIKYVKIYEAHDFDPQGKIIKNRDENHKKEIKFKYNSDYTKLQVRIILLNDFYQRIDMSSIEWINKEEGIGLFRGNRSKDKDFTAIYQFGLDLPRLVNPFAIFSNSEYGVKKIDSGESVIQLISVTYE